MRAEAGMGRRVVAVDGWPLTVKLQRRVDDCQGRQARTDIDSAVHASPVGVLV
ncbi:hypothetical protein QQG74_22320 [Micromonospora sp. FIMYZ51]|uniref:hypothetical protein n=1 Tax=Micromonospora sp. FIMYZ51 TaxID=3051832 RepID=UPI00311D86BF